MSRVKKSRKKATVDFRVQIRRIDVKMNHPYVVLADCWLLADEILPREIGRRSYGNPSGCHPDLPEMFQ